MVSEDSSEDSIEVLDISPGPAGTVEQPNEVQVNQTSAAIAKTSKIAIKTGTGFSLFLRVRVTFITRYSPFARPKDPPYHITRQFSRLKMQLH